MNRADDTLHPELAQLLCGLGMPTATARVTRSMRGRPHDYLVLPRPSRPQLLIPNVGAAASMISERRARGSAAKVLKNITVVALRHELTNRLPLRRLQVGAPGISGLLAWINESGREADESPAPAIYAGVMYGPPRANRKPVLRLFSAEGATTGYAKVGISALTSDLVASEAAALIALDRSGLKSIRTAKVVKFGRFNDHQVLVTTPLHGSSIGRSPTTIPVAPTRELFSAFRDQATPLRNAAELSAPTSTASREAEVIERLSGRLLALVGDERIPLGAAHGDWTPWNMAWHDSGSSRTLEVWDWERFATGTPQGHDVVHFEAAKVRVDRDLTRAEASFRSGLPASLSACGIDPKLTSRLLASYLVAIGRRYAADLNLAYVPSVARRLDWVTDLLTHEIKRLEHDTPGRPVDALGGSR